LGREAITEGAGRVPDSLKASLPGILSEPLTLITELVEKPISGNH
jgi:hypothetical protein